MQTGLIFASGGGLGAYDVGVLRRLYELEPDFQPAVVTGISIGAIQGAILAGAAGNPVDILESFWQELARPSIPFLPKRIDSSLALLGNPNFYQLRPDLFMNPFLTSIYSLHPLRRLVEQYIDFDRLNSSPVRVVIPVANVEQGEIEYIENQGAAKTRIRIQHIMANASLPLTFPMTPVENRLYWDGGLFDHAPFSPVIRRLSMDSGIKKRLLVMSLYAKQESPPTNFMEVYLRMLKLILADKIETAMQSTEQHNRMAKLMSKLEEELPGESPIRSWPELKALQRQEYRFLHDIRHVCNNRVELTSGNLTRNSVRRRMEAGYHDACTMLSPKAML